ncbi:MAG: hypothetical protein KJ667_00525 [Alphaproteobacteria bacterium]|nr:hypothetical protein [Alphaproteobacteria bacterium]
MLKQSILTVLMAGALTSGAAFANAQDTRPFDPARDRIVYVNENATNITGEVTSIQGLKFLTLTAEGTIVGVNMATLPYNPTDPAYTPQLEVGDVVTINGTTSTLDPAELDAREVVAIKKSWQTQATFGQRLIADDFDEIAPAAGDVDFRHRDLN